MKENTPEQQLKLLCRLIIRECAIWNYINENGCNDPFWPDACRDRSGTWSRLCEKF
uniref:SWIB/MDM2 domain n=1 Tax=Siphoviridae sp. ct39g3 TaxID=2825320 RepID=A0A8S5P8J4_9CAUD|nr:MAG TPA: SWIB/MDM2 domain [Siphoviridae sp. ct39g3]